MSEYKLPPIDYVTYWGSTVLKIEDERDGLLFTRRKAGATPYVPNGFDNNTDFYLIPRDLTVPLDDESVMASMYSIYAAYICSTQPCKYVNSYYGLILGDPDPGYEPPPPAVGGRYSWLTIKKVLHSNYYAFPVNRHVLLPQKTLVELPNGLFAASVYGYSSHTGRFNSIPPSAEEYARGAPVIRFQ